MFIPKGTIAQTFFGFYNLDIFIRRNFYLTPIKIEITIL